MDLRINMLLNLHSSARCETAATATQQMHTEFLHIAVCTGCRGALTISPSAKLFCPSVYMPHKLQAKFAQLTNIMVPVSALWIEACQSHAELVPSLSLLCQSKKKYGFFAPTGGQCNFQHYGREWGAIRA